MSDNTSTQQSSTIPSPIRSIPLGSWLNEQIFGRLAFNQRFTPDNRAPIVALFYGLKGSGKSHIVKQIATKLNTKVVEIHLNDLLTNKILAEKTTQDKVHELFQTAYKLESSVAIFHFKNCEILFQEPSLDQIVHLELTTFRSQTTTLICIFSTREPKKFPNRLLDALTGVPIFIPPPTNKERKEYLTRRISAFNKMLVEKECKRIQVPDLLQKALPSDKVLNKIVRDSEGCSLHAIEEFIKSVFSSFCLELQTKSTAAKPLFIKEIVPSDFHYLKATGSVFARSCCSPNEMQEMVEFGLSYGFGSSIRNSFQDCYSMKEIPDCWFPLVENVTNKRRNLDGSWDCKVVFKSYWIPLEQCQDLNAITFSELQELVEENSDTPRENEQQDRDESQAKMKKISQESESQTNIETEASVEDKLVEEIPNIRKRGRTQKASSTTRIQPVATVEQKKRKFTAPEKEQSQEAPGTGLKTANTCATPVTPSDEQKGRSKWHRSYKGALAYAILKGKSWAVTHPDYLDVALESDKKKMGGTVYDWDIIWLALKVIHKELLNFQGGLNLVRKFLKDHPVIAPHIAEW
jgi:hypothetical protein